MLEGSLRLPWPLNGDLPGLTVRHNPKQLLPAPVGPVSKLQMEVWVFTVRSILLMRLMRLMRHMHLQVDGHPGKHMNNDMSASAVQSNALSNTPVVIEPFSLLV